MSKRDLTFVVSDLQVPFHDDKFVDAMARCIDDNAKRIRNVITIGDEQDFQTISRWAQGTALEWEKSIGRDRDTTVDVLKRLRVTDSIRSNHTDRLWQQTTRRMPGLIGLPELELENFWRLPDLGISFHPHGFQFAKDWIALHGDESGISQIAGMTSKNLVLKTGLNVVNGHTHRLGLVPTTYSVHGKVTRTLIGMEVGHAMDLRRASYVKTHNWQQGWGAFRHDGNVSHPILMPVVKRSFTFEGTVYTW